jgi:DNA-directed RNA polymerase specialized sigma subunit
MKQRKYESFDDSFYRLAGEVTRALERNKDGTIQQEQVEELLDAERKFKETILKYRQATDIYRKFLQKVCVQNKNILSARPYFRETAVIFSKKITPAIKAAEGLDPKDRSSEARSKGLESLKTFDINYQFIKFIRQSWLGPFPKRAEQLFQRVHMARTRLIENNMPLAINRAKLFYRKTPKSHLTLMDFIGICSMGLAAGIDKWCGKYSPVFRSVCIGRMVGNMIDSYSETMLHFYPSDKRILYKAHTIRGRRGIDEIGELTEAVNKAFIADELEGKTVPKTNLDTSELNALMNAASTVSADATVNGEGFGVYDYTEDSNKNVEDAYAERETTEEMLWLAKGLPLLHRKVLKLKGIKI